MAKKDKTLGDFHKPSSNKHPKDSIGNQQLWKEGKQVGSLEYIPDSTEGLHIRVHNTKDKKIKKL